MWWTSVLHHHQVIDMENIMVEQKNQVGCVKNLVVLRCHIWHWFIDIYALVRPAFKWKCLHIHVVVFRLRTFWTTNPYSNSPSPLLQSSNKDVKHGQMSMCILKSTYGAVSYFQNKKRTSWGLSLVVGSFSQGAQSLRLAWTILNSVFLRISRHKQGRRRGPKDNQFLWGKSILWLSLHHHNCSLVCYVYW